MAPHRITRRDFLATGAVAAAAAAAFPVYASPNEKLDIACVGVGGRGGANIGEVSSENIVAICDVDEHNLDKASERFPKARKFLDYRRLFDAMSNQIDAVVVSTPDHMHAPISLRAMQLGKHVYCEKPITRLPGEARRMAEAARKHRVTTQMGNNGNAALEARLTVELIRAEAVGPVREVHAWTGRPGGMWMQGMDAPKEGKPVPEWLHWDLWLGVAKERPYHPAYVPGRWRGWYDFGTGPIGDMGAHICNVAFWGLGLRDPQWAEAEVSDRHEASFPNWSRITMGFPERAGRPAVKLHWYDGGKRPPVELGDGNPLPDSGMILIGEKGRMYIPSSDGKGTKLLPQEKFENFKRPPRRIPESPGHHKEWIFGCKQGWVQKEQLSHFGRAGLMIEALTLGIVAIRAGKRIEWDAENQKVTNVPEANEFIHGRYRKGWEI